MAMLEGLKDENGKLKKPILISLIGAGGLVGYLLLSKSSGSNTTTSAGQSSALTPDLTGLQTALQALATTANTNGGGGSGTSPSLDPPPNPGGGSPTSPPVPGSSGSAGGGGGGTGAVIYAIAQDPTVYAGLTLPGTIPQGAPLNPVDPVTNLDASGLWTGTGVQPIAQPGYSNVNPTSVTNSAVAVISTQPATASTPGGVVDKSIKTSPHVVVDNIRYGTPASNVIPGNPAGLVQAPSRTKS